MDSPVICRKVLIIPLELISATFALSPKVRLYWTQDGHCDDDVLFSSKLSVGRTKNFPSLATVTELIWQ